MKVLWSAIARMPRWQRGMIAGLLILILLTWLATCVVLAGLVGP